MRPGRDLTELPPGSVAVRAELDRTLGIRIDDDLLTQALTHRSFAYEAGDVLHNERLELLGDAVVGMVVTDQIYRRFPDEAEGRLAKLRAAVVSTASLASVGRELGIGRAVRLGVGEEATGGRDKDSILADTFEAVVGAIYLDAGTDTAFSVVAGFLEPVIDRLAARRESLDWKTSLQELTAAQLATLPRYELTETGPDHAKCFTATALVDGEEVGRGEGRSKKTAEQAAAEEAYGVLRARLAARLADEEVTVLPEPGGLGGSPHALGSASRQHADPQTRGDAK